MLDARILLVDDDPNLLRVVELGLAARGYAVRTATTGRDALEDLDLHEPDLLILDLGLPDLDGLDVARHVRARSRASVLVLTADGAEDRKVRALDEGADDYLTKPFSMPELLARIRVALRHRHERGASLPAPEVLRAGSLVVDLTAHAARAGSAELDLTPKEFALLALFVRHHDRVLTHRSVIDQLWGSAQALDTLRNHVAQLRRKLPREPDVPRIVTESGVGYRLVVPETDPDG